MCIEITYTPMKAQARPLFLSLYWVNSNKVAIKNKHEISL